MNLLRVLSFTIAGKAVPAARAGRRFNPKTGITRSFTPEKTANFKTLAMLSFQIAYPGFVPVTGPVEMVLAFYLPPPQSFPKRLLAAIAADENAVPHIKKPDGKNFRWGIEDALEGRLFINDSQVFRYSDTKTYSLRPRTEVLIRIYE